MKISAIILGMLLSFPLLAQSGAGAELERAVAGEIRVATDGSVLSYTITDKLTPGLKTALDGSIRRWRFEPIMVEGRPVIAKTSMRIQLLLIPDGENFRFRVAGAHFSAPTRRNRLEPPRYPEVAAYKGVGAKVMLVVRLDARGDVIQVHPEQVSLSKRTHSEKTAERWREMFSNASVEAAQRWKFDVAEIVDGEPRGTSVRVPVEYLPPGQSNQGQWLAYIPGPFRPTPWVDQDSLATESKEELENGEMRSLDSRFKLLGDVEDSLL